LDLPQEEPVLTSAKRKRGAPGEGSSVLILMDAMRGEDEAGP